MISVNSILQHKITTPKKKRKNGNDSNNFTLLKRMKLNDIISCKDGTQDMVNSEPSSCDNEDDSDLFFFDISGNKNNLYLDTTPNEFINGTNNQVSSKLNKLNDSFTLPKRVKKKNQSEINIGIRDNECEITGEYLLHKKKPGKSKKKRILDQSETNHIIDPIKVLVDSENKYNKKVDKQINSSGHSINEEAKKVKHTDCQKLISHIDIDTKKTKKKVYSETVVDITNSDCEVKNGYSPYKKNEKNEIIKNSIDQIRNCEYKSKKKIRKKLSAIDSSSSRENMEFNLELNVHTSSDKITENSTDIVNKKLEPNDINLSDDLSSIQSVESGSNECTLHRPHFQVSYRSDKKHKNKKLESENLTDFKSINIEFSSNECLDLTNSTNSSLDKQKVKKKKHKQDISGIVSLSDSSSSRRNNEESATDFVPNHKENIKRDKSKKTVMENYIGIHKTKTKTDSDSTINSIPLRKSKKRIHDVACVEDNRPIAANSFFTGKKKKKSEIVKGDHTIGCEDKVFSKEECHIPEINVKGYDIKNFNLLKSKKREGNDYVHEYITNTKNSKYDVISCIHDISKKCKSDNINLSEDLTIKKSLESGSNESILYHSSFQVSCRSDKKHKKKNSKSEIIVDLKPINVDLSDHEYPNPIFDNSPLNKKIVKNRKYKRGFNNDNKCRPKKTDNKYETALDNDFDEGIMNLSDYSSSKRNNEENIADCMSKPKENSKKGKTKKTLIDNHIQNTMKESDSDSEINSTPLREIVKEDLEHAIGDNKLFSKEEYSTLDEITLKGYDQISELNWLKSNKMEKNDNMHEEIMDIKTNEYDEEIKVIKNSEYDATSCISDTIVYKKKSKKKDRSNKRKLNVMEQILPENLVISSDSSEIMSPLEILENCLKPQKSKNTREQNDDVCEEILDVKNTTYKVTNCANNTISPIKTNENMDNLLKIEQRRNKIIDIGVKESGVMEEGISDVKIFAKSKNIKDSLEDFLSRKDSTNEEDEEIFSKIKKEATEDIKKLEVLDIQLPFSVAPLHSILTRPSKPTSGELEKIKLSNIKIKTGPFSKEEDEKIIQNWSNFCKEYGLNRNSLVIVSFPRRLSMLKKTNILRYLGYGLDNRMLHRIHARFKTLIQKCYMKIGRYTAEEDKMILDYIKETSSSCPFRDLSEILNREKLSIQKRYDLLTRDRIDKIMWTPEMVDKFVTCMKKITKCEKTKHLKSIQLTTKQWKKLSKKLNNIPVKKLQQAWKITIYPRLYSKEVDMRNVKKKIVDILCERNETDWRTTNWTEISSGFKGFTPEKIYMIFKKLVINRVPEDKQKNLEECIRYLKSGIEKYESIYSSREFRKFVCKDGHLVYESEMC